MPVLAENPTRLSKSRLKPDLIAHSVTLPLSKSKKFVYVDLCLKHVELKNAADFSSDDEWTQVKDVEEEDPDMLDPSSLTDDELKAMLLKHKVQAGPIVASTRAVYEKKLMNVCQPDAQFRMNSAVEGIRYSESEAEVDDEPGSAVAKQKTASHLEPIKQDCSQRACPSLLSEPSPKETVAKSRWSRSYSSQIPMTRSSCVEQLSSLKSGGPPGSQSLMSKGSTSLSSQTFSITQMVEEMESRGSFSPSADTDRETNGNSVQEHWSLSSRLDKSLLDKHSMKKETSYYTPTASPHKWGMKAPVKDALTDLFPDTHVTPTGIYVTRRRPIKGAAGRPVQYVYPDTPVSPMTPVSPLTLERRELERCLVPVQIQILVFLGVVFLLYLIYLYMEEDAHNVFVALDSSNRASDRL